MTLAMAVRQATLVSVAVSSEWYSAWPYSRKAGVALVPHSAEHTTHKAVAPSGDDTCLPSSRPP